MLCAAPRLSRIRTGVVDTCDPSCNGAGGQTRGTTKAAGNRLVARLPFVKPNILCSAVFPGEAGSGTTIGVTASMESVVRRPPRGDREVRSVLAEPVLGGCTPVTEAMFDPPCGLAVCLWVPEASRLLRGGPNAFTGRRTKGEVENSALGRPRSGLREARCSSPRAVAPPVLPLDGPMTGIVDRTVRGACPGRGLLGEPPTDLRVVGTLHERFSSSCRDPALDAGPSIAKAVLAHMQQTWGRPCTHTPMKH
mmetsp:Transcript_128925/g.241145  ORF Transcript_128925/g.241145 Transcript_128925/m.241145 type:complete len:251 (+) Transcript_128925:526-1278(+)